MTRKREQEELSRNGARGAVGVGGCGSEVTPGKAGNLQNTDTEEMTQVTGDRWG